MLSPAFGRAVRSSGSISTAAVCTLSRPAIALGTVQPSFSQPCHQRRLSSSKASIPPDGSNTNGPSSPQQTPASANKSPSRKVTGRSSKKRSATPALNVPHVPPTDYLQKPEVKISSFFSLHRPISLTTPIPPVATHKSFDSIFKARALNDRKALASNIQTISSGIENLEAALRMHESEVPEDISLQANVEVQHLDGPPQASVDQLMARLVPFRPPPAPVPFEAGLAEASTLGIADVPVTGPTKRRAWSTAVVVTESTDSSGKRTYSATTAPMVEIPVPGAKNGQEVDQINIRQPFLERMKHRQITQDRYRGNLRRPDMEAISVKRQRKLKMKKHKYKKLMKRTRLERKKLDRL